MRFDQRSLPLDHLRANDAVYRITTSGAVVTLTHSIAELGVLHPPTVRRRAGGYQIVAGFRRIAACRHLGWSAVAARILPEHSDHAACVRLAIADNSLQRPLNLIETARALALLADVAADESEWRRQAALLSLPSNPVLMRKTMALTTLPPDLQATLASGGLSLSMALELKRFGNATAASLARLFTDLKLGLNRQREIVTLLEDIARRDRTTVAKVLAQPALQAILRAPAHDRTQKAERLRRHLRRRRYPQISAASDRFDTLVRQLNLGPGVRLTPPAHFEGATYTLTILFERLEQLRERSRQIQTLLSSRPLSTFMEE
jgi:ParB family chromosome partitioning protein